MQDSSIVNLAVHVGPVVVACLTNICCCIRVDSSRSSHEASGVKGGTWKQTYGGFGDKTLLGSNGVRYSTVPTYVVTDLLPILGPNEVKVYYALLWTVNEESSFEFEVSLNDLCWTSGLTYETFNKH